MLTAKYVFNNCTYSFPLFVKDTEHISLLASCCPHRRDAHSYSATPYAATRQLHWLPYYASPLCKPLACQPKPLEVLTVHYAQRTNEARLLSQHSLHGGSDSGIVLSMLGSLMRRQGVIEPHGEGIY